jgi:toxin ParE1/3/4
MRLRFTPRARRHLEAIAEYLQERSPAAAREVGARIRETVQLLVTFPMIGHQGVLDGTREVVVPGLPYIIVHRVDRSPESMLVILGIYHGAQLRPGQEKK